MRSAITHEDVVLMKASHVIAEMLESEDGQVFRKRAVRKVDQLGPPAASVFSLPDERAGVDRKTPRDDNERRIAEMQTRVSTLNTLIQTGQNQDIAAMVRERDQLMLQISVLTLRPQRSDRSGSVLGVTIAPKGLV
jgi:hypothetical protein